MAIRMVGLDLDGTLFTSGKKLTERTRAVLAEAARRGVVVTPATGRPRVGLPEELLALPGIRYAVVANGAAVYDLQEGRRLYENCIPKGTAAGILRRTRVVEAVQSAFIGDWGYMEQVDAFRVHLLDMAEAMRQYMLVSRKVVDDLAAYVLAQEDGPQKLVLTFLKTPAGELIGAREVRALLEAEYPQLEYVSGGVGNLEISNTGSGKGTALLRLGADLGIAPEEIMAVGDSENDLDMIQKAGLGVAMANAEEILKRHAGALTASNDEDGVAAAIERYVFGERKETV